MADNVAISLPTIHNTFVPKQFRLNKRQLCDLELIMNGGFAPLTGFMCKNDYESVMLKCRLSSGEVWPLPIVLAIGVDLFESHNNEIDTVIDLLDECDNVIAKLHVAEIYQPNIPLECEYTLGTTDNNHPYVEYLQSLGNVYYVGGNVEHTKGVQHYDFYKYRLSPAQLKEKIKLKNWTRTLGFQTRNPMHNCHYALTNFALDQINVPKGHSKGLVLHPVVGVTQSNDIDYCTRVRCYEHLLKKYESENVNVILSLLPLSMRMAGPREALMHALIRYNYGCTDFVIGRDHAGPSNKASDGTSFYSGYDAHEFVNNFKDDIPINIIKSSVLVYSDELKRYTTIDKCVGGCYRDISGTELRKKLRARENIPEWFTINEVSKELQNYYCDKKGMCIYLIGLSGAGKTTLSLALKQRLRERMKEDEITLLDGDIIREHLGQGLGFSKQDRSINVRRIGYVASLIVKAKGTVVCANIAPYDDDRLYNRKLIEDMGGKYIEVLVDTPLELCEKRDIKGLYKKARANEILNFTGISDPFEYPSKADLHVFGYGDINKTLDKIEEYCFNT